MNKIIYKSLLAEDKFMSGMHLRQAKLTFSACGTYTKNKETGDPRYIYRKKLDKACFNHDIAYHDFKTSPRRTNSDKFLRNEAFNIAK